MYLNQINFDIKSEFLDNSMSYIFDTSLLSWLWQPGNIMLFKCRHKVVPIPIYIPTIFLQKKHSPEILSPVVPTPGIPLPSNHPSSVVLSPTEQ